MTPDPIVVSPETKLPEAHKLMMAANIRRLPVVEAGRLVGLVTLGDIREASPPQAASLSLLDLSYLLSNLSVAEVMTRQPITITPDATIQETAHRMLTHKVSGLPVVEQEKLVGIITESDIFRLLSS